MCEGQFYVAQTITNPMITTTTTNSTKVSPLDSLRNILPSYFGIYSLHEQRLCVHITDIDIGPLDCPDGPFFGKPILCSVHLFPHTQLAYRMSNGRSFIFGWSYSGQLQGYGLGINLL